MTIRVGVNGFGCMAKLALQTSCNSSELDITPEEASWADCAIANMIARTI